MLQIKEKCSNIYLSGVLYITHVDIICHFWFCIYIFWDDDIDMQAISKTNELISLRGLVKGMGKTMSC